MCYLMELLLLSFARGIYIHVLWYNAVKSESVVLGHGITVPQRCVCDINAQQLVDLSINYQPQGQIIIIIIIGYEIKKPIVVVSDVFQHIYYYSSNLI